MRATISPVRASIRATLLDDESVVLPGIQKLPSLTANAPSRPRRMGDGILRTFESVAGSISLNAPSPHVATHTRSIAVTTPRHPSAGSEMSALVVFVAG